MRSRGVSLVLDPLAPPPSARHVWDRLEATSPEVVVMFADALTAPGGTLRVWASRWHEERTLPTLRAMLALPFEQVVVAHGEPVHARAAFTAALEREPWSQDEAD